MLISPPFFQRLMPRAFQLHMYTWIHIHVYSHTYGEENSKCMFMISMKPLYNSFHVFDPIRKEFKARVYNFLF